MHELVKASADLLESRCAAIDLHYQRFPNTSDRTMEDTAKAIRCILEALRLSSGDQGWQDIATAPKDGTEVLVEVRPKVIRLGWYFKRSSRTEGWCDENGKSINPLRWAPLPSDHPQQQGEKP